MTMNEHSEMFEQVKYWYDHKMWNKKRVRNAVGRWITQEECDEILGVNANG